ncbi:MAG: 16S rRNA (cytidine(1402)-2'-O)-methyltransferase [Bifidobacteriaceae bacterium]|jgi:16S rRNA (cytidine1402-2'-O)-methyltransferase|nr:16S rRNA (cytidine(1402)-2'-O)-methyltransferase [Bifidobacteriaceae bacterium]
MNSKSPGIVLVASPIGNPADASDHLRDLLHSATLVAAEDTRRLRALARRLEVTVTGKVVSFYDHNERSRIPLLLAHARTGVVAVVSDAGTPLLSDPGFPLVKAAIEASIEVRCAPGPSAVLVALSLSGLPADRFAFDGFVPRAARARAAWLEQIAAEQRTVVVFEAGRRVAQTLAEAAERLGADRPGVIARELTKPHQELIRGSLAELAASAAEREFKGEVTLVIGAARHLPPHQDGAGLAALVQAVDRLTAEGRGLKEAVAAVAAQPGSAGQAHVSKRALYQAVLESANSREDH